MPDNLAVFFLAQDEQPAAAVMNRLTDFIGAARQTLDFAFYDMRLSDPLKNLLSAALHERMKRKPLCLGALSASARPRST